MVYGSYSLSDRVRLLFDDSIGLQKAGDLLEQVPSGVGTLADAVRSVRVGQHLEGLVELNQLVDQQLGALIVAVVVARAVDEQQALGLLHLVSEGDGRPQTIALRVIRRQAHVPMIEPNDML